MSLCYHKKHYFKHNTNNIRFIATKLIGYTLLMKTRNKVDNHIQKGNVFRKGVHDMYGRLKNLQRHIS